MTSPPYANRNRIAFMPTGIRRMPGASFPCQKRLRQPWLGTKATLGDDGRPVRVASVPKASAPFQAWNEDNAEEPVDVVSVPSLERKRHRWNITDAFGMKATRTRAEREATRRRTASRRHYRPRLGTETTLLAGMRIGYPAIMDSELALGLSAWLTGSADECRLADSGRPVVGRRASPVRALSASCWHREGALCPVSFVLRGMLGCGRFDRFGRFSRIGA